MLPIRILLANHQPLIRNGLRLLLEREPDFQVVAEAANGREAIVLNEFKHPDVALLEVKLPLVNGIVVAKEISAKERCPKTVFVTVHTDESYVIEAFKAGARGYVSGDSAPIELARAIHVVASGRVFISPEISAHFLDGHVSEGIVSEYEKELCCLLAAGYGEGEIAACLEADVNKIRVDCRAISNSVHWSALPEAVAKSICGNQCVLGNA